MSRQWKPGNVALVECSDGEWRQATCEPHANWSDVLVWRFPDRVYRHVSDSNARPLVVIDPDSDEQVERLAQSYRDNAGAALPVSVLMGRVKSALAGLVIEPIEVYEHFTHTTDRGAGRALVALCGKVWVPGRPNTVSVGKCPECDELSSAGWVL